MMAGKKEPEYVRFINKIREDEEKKVDYLKYGYTEEGLIWLKRWFVKAEKAGILDANLFSAHDNKICLEWCCDEAFMTLNLCLKTKIAIWMNGKRRNIDFTFKNINQGMQQLKKEVDAFYSANMPGGFNK